MVSKSFSIDTSEILKLADSLGKTAGQTVRDELTTAMVRSNEHVEEAAKSLINRKFVGPLAGPRTGPSLVNSFKNRVQVYAKSTVGIVENVAKHAKWVNNGRGPVVATRAKALRFAAGGGVIFRKRVGPAAAQHFMERGLDKAKAAIQGEFNAAARRIAAEIGGR